MNTLSVITTKGQITVPGKIRQQLGVKIGDRFYFDEVIPEKKQVTIRLISKDVVDELFGSLSSSKKASFDQVRKKAAKIQSKKYFK